MHRRASTRPDRGNLRFPGHELDLDSGELRRHGIPVPLRPQAMIVLKTLLRRYPRLVTREELRHALWGTTHVAWEVGLHQIVRQLRRALGDDPRDPSFIQTVPRRGYRFTAAVSTHPSTATRLRSAGRDLTLWLGGVLTLPALLILLCLLLGL